MRKIILLICFFSFVFCEDIQIIEVYDGDTIKALLNNKVERVRLYGIDAPELKQEHGQVSKEVLRKMCENKKVRLKLKGVDRYNRQLGILYCGRINVNKALLSKGHAWSYNNWNKELEIRASKEKIGLWKNKNPINPKEYRKK